MPSSRPSVVRTARLYCLWFGALLILCYFPVIGNITHQWHSDDDMAHGVFVPVIVGYIIWERRQSLLSQEPVRSRWGLVVILWGAVQACVGALGAEIFLQRAALLISIFGIILYFAGTRAFRILAFPLLLLGFMLPIPGIVYKQITFPLQLVASRIAESGLELLGYMVVREGNILELAGQSLSVVEACSGIRALLSLSFFSLTYAFLVSKRTWIRWALLLAAVPIAVAANAFRIVVTGILGEHDPKLAAGFFHGFSGWVIFVVAIALIIGTQKLLSRFSHA